MDRIKAYIQDDKFKVEIDRKSFYWGYVHMAQQFSHQWREFINKDIVDPKDPTKYTTRLVGEIGYYYYQRDSKTLYKSYVFKNGLLIDHTVLPVANKITKAELLTISDKLDDLLKEYMINDVAV